MNITKILTYSTKNGHATSGMMAVSYVRLIQAGNPRNRTWLRVGRGLPYQGALAAASGIHSPVRQSTVATRVNMATGSDQLTSDSRRPNSSTQSQMNCGRMTAYR